MSFYKQNIRAFIHIMEKHNALFSDHWHELNEWLQTLPENAQQISKAISQWCEARPEIYKAQTAALKSLISLGTSDKRCPGGIHYPPQPPASEKDLAKQLRNAIRRCSSPQPSSKISEPDKNEKTSD